MHRIHNWFRNTSLRKKLIFVFSGIFMSAMAFVVATSSIITWNLSKNDARSHSSQLLQEFDRNLEYIFTDTENISRFAIYEDQVQKYLQTSDSDAGYYTTMLAARDTLLNAILQKNYVESITIYSLDSKELTVGSSPAYATSYKNIREQSWFAPMMEQIGLYLWDISEFEKGQPRITCARVINDKETIAPLGVLVILLNPRYMDELAAQTGGEQDEFFCLDPERKLIIAPWEKNETNLAQNLLLHITETKSQADIREINGYILTTSPMYHTKWLLLSASPANTYLKSQRINLLLIFLATVFSMAVSFIAYARFARSITFPIQNMIESMEKAEQDNFKTTVKMERADEIGRLGGAYNSLIRRLNILVNDVLRERLRSSQAELESLQAQINPHFLYNTLDCINWKAMLSQQHEISDMITALSNMFRFSLSGNSKMVSLQEEIANVQDYLFIQQKRFEEKLDAVVDIPKECLQISVLKYTLQPLVENSILHSVGETGLPVRVLITATLQEHQLELQVSDNGPGVDMEHIERLLAGFKPEDGKKHRHGIYNVHQRLKLQYGENYGLRYSNLPGGGTRVRVLIADTERRLIC